MSESLVRLRIQFAKTEAIRFTSHLDLHRTWERTFRRAGLPLAYRQGFNPQARINLASALPLGFTSQAELMDVWLENPVPIIEIESKLIPALPPGLEITAIQEVDLTEPALQVQVQSAEYLISLKQPVAGLDVYCERLMKSEKLERSWKGKIYDLRPLILDLQVVQSIAEPGQAILIRLSAREGATGRPEEVLSALGIQPDTARIHRTRIVR